MILRVSIVDDDAPTRQLLQELLQQSDQLEFAHEYPDTESALASIPHDRPDVVLMDINVPKLNGIDCVRLLKPQLPDTQFLMLTVYGDTDHIFAALEAGATGYLLKKTSRTQLLSAIKQIARGGSPMSYSIARKVVQSFSKPKTHREREPEAEIAELSPREHTVLDLLSQGYLYKEIADTLGLSPMTIDTYSRRIYEKLQVNSRSQAIAKFLRH